MVGAAALAGLGGWVVAEGILGVDLRAPVFDPSRPSWDIDAPLVVATAGLASLAGWAVLRVLERITTHARVGWTTIASAVLVLSLAGPMSGTGLDAAQRGGLVILHLAVGGVLIVGLARSTVAEHPRS